MVTDARPAAAWRSVLVSASWTMRYAVSSAAAPSRNGVPSTARSTGSPVARTRSTSALRSPMPGCGASPAAGSSVRSTPSIARMSVRARRPTSETSVIASAPRAGSARPTTAAASASVITTDKLCDTMSCSSLAIRVRSAAAAITACWSRSTSSLRARSSIQARYLLPEATVSPANNAATTVADRNSSERSAASGRLPLDRRHDGAGFEQPGGEQGPRRDSCAATVYSATSSAVSPRSGKPSSHWANAMALMTGRPRTGRGGGPRAADQRGLHDGRR